MDRRPARDRLTRRGRWWLPLLWLLLLGAPAAAEQLPLVPFSARYELARDGLPIGETRVELQLLGDGGYLYRAHTEPGPLLSLFREDLILEESRGRLVEGRPQPDRYSYRRDGPGVRRSLELRFDWDRGRVRISDGSSHWYLEVAPGTLDKLVQQLVFSRDLAAGERAPSYRVADGGTAKEYAYRILGREPVTTPLGRFDTLKAERRKDQGPADYTLWLAPELGYRPVRILRQHHGTDYRMELIALER
jgi:hypothetical protein